METIKNIHSISANYFFLMAFLYVAAALAFRNHIYADAMLSGMRLMDIPFGFISLAYGGSGLYLQINDGGDESSLWGIVIFALCLFLFAALIFVSFAFPSVL